MLVLSRKKNETVMIGDSIKVTVTRIAGERVRLSIDAPKTVSVYRGEIADRLAKEKQQEQEGA